jgi:CheY-like chemotaxis protein
MVWSLDGLIPDQKTAKSCRVSDRWRVLVVDDDKALSHLLEVILEGEGYDFTFTETGKDAVDLWCANDYPPIILLDWSLPDLQGIEVCKQLRAHPQGKFAYIMFLTAKGLREHRIAGIVAGADDYVVKPIHAEELKARMRSAVRILELQKQLIERNKMLEEFVYSVTHDMRTPLLAMEMTASQAAEGVYGQLPDGYSKILTKTRRSIGDLLKLADNLLRIAGYETGESEEAEEKTGS